MLKYPVFRALQKVTAHEVLPHLSASVALAWRVRISMSYKEWDHNKAAPRQLTNVTTAHTQMFYK